MEIRCPHCGYPINKGEYICPRCGEVLKSLNDPNYVPWEDEKDKSEQ